MQIAFKSDSLGYCSAVWILYTNFCARESIWSVPCNEDFWARPFTWDAILWVLSAITAQRTETITRNEASVYTHMLISLIDVIALLLFLFLCHESILSEGQEAPSDFFSLGAFVFWIHIAVQAARSFESPFFRIIMHSPSVLSKCYKAQQGWRLVSFPVCDAYCYSTWMLRVPTGGVSRQGEYWGFWETVPPTPPSPHNLTCFGLVLTEECLDNGGLLVQSSGSLGFSGRLANLGMEFHLGLGQEGF